MAATTAAAAANTATLKSGNNNILNIFETINNKTLGHKSSALPTKLWLNSIINGLKMCSTDNYRRGALCVLAAMRLWQQQLLFAKNEQKNKKKEQDKSRR